MRGRRRERTDGKWWHDSLHTGHAAGYLGPYEISLIFSQIQFYFLLNSIFFLLKLF